MGQDSLREPPALRLARAIGQLYGWFELHGGPAGDAVHGARAHLLSHALTDDPDHAQAARAALQRLLADDRPVALSARAALGEACLQANEVLGDRLYLEAAHSLCEGIAQGVRADDGQALCFSALPGRMLGVHHANLQAAALLARVGRRTGEVQFMHLARRATAYALAHQRADGSWLHGEVKPLRWLDAFHAGERVRSLLELAQGEAHPGVYAALARALRHLVALHFDPEGGALAAAREEEPGECELLAAAGAIGALARTAAIDPHTARRASTQAAGLAYWASRHLQAWSLWRDPPSVHGPGRLLEALVLVQVLGEAPWSAQPHVPPEPQPHPRPHTGWPAAVGAHPAAPVQARLH